MVLKSIMNLKSRSLMAGAALAILSVIPLTGCAAASTSQGEELPETTGAVSVLLGPRVLDEQDWGAIGEQFWGGGRVEWAVFDSDWRAQAGFSFGTKTGPSSFGPYPETLDLNEYSLGLVRPFDLEWKQADLVVGAGVSVTDLGFIRGLPDAPDFERTPLGGFVSARVSIPITSAFARLGLELKYTVHEDLDFTYRDLEVLHVGLAFIYTF